MEDVSYGTSHHDKDGGPERSRRRRPEFSWTCILLLTIPMGLAVSCYLSMSLQDPGSSLSQQVAVDSLQQPQVKYDIDKLIADMNKNVEAKYLNQCLSVVNGSGTFTQAQQDWILFHNYFKNKPWGDGFYLDLGANDPFDISNSLFFDKCLGWKGICVEPNPSYHPLYENRSCKLFKNCLYKEEKTLRLTAKAGVFARVLEPGEASDEEIVTVQCRTLDSILDEAGVQKVDFASLDVEGQEVPSLQCFDFDKYDIKLWIVETNKQDKYFDFLMNRAGYMVVKKVLLHNHDSNNCGFDLDTLYEKQQPRLKMPEPLAANPNYRMCFLEDDALGDRAPRCKVPGLPLST